MCNKRAGYSYRHQVACSQQQWSWICKDRQDAPPPHPGAGRHTTGSRGPAQSTNPPRASQPAGAGTLSVLVVHAAAAAAAGLGPPRHLGHDDLVYPQHRHRHVGGQLQRPPLGGQQVVDAQVGAEVAGGAWGVGVSRRGRGGAEQRGTNSDYRRQHMIVHHTHKQARRSRLPPPGTTMPHHRPHAQTRAPHPSPRRGPPSSARRCAPQTALPAPLSRPGRCSRRWCGARPPAPRRTS